MQPQWVFMKKTKLGNLAQTWKTMNISYNELLSNRQLGLDWYKLKTG